MMLRFAAVIAVVITLQLNLAASKSIGNDYVITGRMKQLAKRVIRQRRDAKEEIAVEKFHVLSKINSRYSVVAATSVVRNGGDTAKEIKFNLKLPKTAFISNFSMEIDGEIYVGVVKSKETARKEYDTAVAAGHNAALVKTKVRNTQQFDVSVNVAAGGAVTFVLEYQELLQRKLGKYSHSIFATPDTDQWVPDYLVEVYITEAIGITELEANLPDDDKEDGDDDMMDGYNNVDVRRSGTMGYIVYTPSKEQQKAKMNPSITVTYDVERENVAGELLIRDGYFIHFFAPTDLPIIPKNVVFIIDKSGSMSGRKMEQTKEAMTTILNDLKAHDRFNIITFERIVETWRDGEMMDVNPRTVEKAINYVQSIPARGGTNFNDAILKGVELLSTVTDGEASDMNRASMIIMLTDGEPTSGESDTGRIKHNVKQANKQRYSVFCLGFGASLDHKFLKEISQENQGISRRIYEDSDAPLQLKGFFDEVAAPMLAHVVIQYTKGARRITGNEFDKFFAGSEIVIAGKLDEDVGFDLSASVSASQLDGSFSVTSYGEKVDRTFTEGTFDMEKMWAYLTIKDLIHKKSLSRFQDETKAKRTDERILRIALKHNFVTDMTSMIAKKPEENEEPAEDEEASIVDDDDTVLDPRLDPQSYGRMMHSSPGRSSSSGRSFSSGRSGGSPYFSHFSRSRHPNVGRSGTGGMAGYGRSAGGGLGRMARPHSVPKVASLQRLSYGPAATHATYTTTTTRHYPFPTHGNGRMAYDMFYDSEDQDDYDGPEIEHMTTPPPDVPCEPLDESIRHGTVVCTGNTYRETCDFTCDSGYHLNGHAQITCLRDGQWDYSQPKCRPVKCDPVNESVRNGAVECTGNKLDETCNFSCDSGYQLSGEAQLTCISDGSDADGTGRWDHSPPRCKLSARPIPDNPLDGSLTSNCFEQIEVDGLANITSPRYPGLYPNGQHCVWEITKSAPNSQDVPLQLEFVKMDLEKGNANCERDRVLVYSYSDDTTIDGEAQVVCGYQLPSQNHLTAPHKFVLVLETDDVVQGRGFRATVN